MSDFHLHSKHNCRELFVGIKASSVFPFPSGPSQSTSALCPSKNSAGPEEESGNSSILVVFAPFHDTTTSHRNIEIYAKE